MPVGLADAAAQDRGGLFPWQIDDDAPAGAAPIGTGFEVTMPDLAFILDSIKIAEYHMGPTFDPADPCGNIIGPNPGQITGGPNAEVLPFGLRTLNGICNNLVPGQEKYGATGEPFIHLTSTTFGDAEVIDCDGPFGPAAPAPSTYDFPNTNTCVGDSEPRIISNLISDQTNTNPAAAAAAGNPVDPGAGVSYDIENVAPDEGLSAPFNSTLTFFGQFFDHGLDLTTKTGGTVFVPLEADDPLIAQAGQTPFMVLSRAEFEGGEPVNQTSPFVDQNQTYTSHPSQQIFHREYTAATVDPDGAGPQDVGDPVSTGRLLNGLFSGEEGLATWADVKANALMLGFALSDEDVHEVPLMAADFYGTWC